MTKELVAVARAALDYIDALPKEVVASLPAMPGFDRDWAENVLAAAVPADVLEQVVPVDNRFTVAMPAELNLTAADMEVLNKTPDGWFRADQLYINRPMYRCERLEQRGKLQRRVLGTYPNIWSEFKRIESNAT